MKHAVDHLVEMKILHPTQRPELHASLAKAFSPFNLDRALDHAEVVEGLLAILDPHRFEAWLNMEDEPERHFCRNQPR